MRHEFVVCCAFYASTRRSMACREFAWLRAFPTRRALKATTQRRDGDFRAPVRGLRTFLGVTYMDHGKYGKYSNKYGKYIKKIWDIYQNRNMVVSVMGDPLYRRMVSWKIPSSNSWMMTGGTPTLRAGNHQRSAIKHRCGKDVASKMLRGLIPSPYY